VRTAAGQGSVAMAGPHRAGQFLGWSARIGKKFWSPTPSAIPCQKA